MVKMENLVADAKDLIKRPKEKKFLKECDGKSKIRSDGKGRGLGTGKGKGPRGPIKW